MYTRPVHIVIAGYPKSGTHWLSNMVASIVDADKVEDLFSMNQKVESEVSSPICWKTHFNQTQIEKVLGGQNTRVVMVVRDPRDIAVSGAHFFSFLPELIVRIVNMLPGGRRLYSKIKWPMNKFISYQYKLNRMVNAVLYGDARISVWCREPWDKYVSSFNDDQSLIIRYEDLLESPIKQCKILCEHLGAKKSDNELNRIITQHKIENTKPRTVLGYKHTRLGSSGYWKNEMSTKMISEFKNSISEKMAKQGYTIDE